MIASNRLISFCCTVARLVPKSTFTSTTRPGRLTWNANGPSGDCADGHGISPPKRATLGFHPATSMIIISPPPPCISTLLFVVW